MQHAVLLSLGANIGDPESTILRAADVVRTTLLEDVVVSSLWRTAPVGYADQPYFVNAALVGKTTTDVVSLHRQLKELEQSLGRTKRERWREREIDIDIILYGDVVMLGENDTALTIRHPRMGERRFVLAPSAEIAPDMVCPSNGKTIAELLDMCADTSAVERVVN